MFEKFLNKLAVNRIQNTPSARDLLIHSYDDFNIEHTKYGFNSLVESIGNAVPDMMWAKDMDGKYLWANQQIIDGLLFSGSLENTLGRGDVEMAMERIAVVGADMHTFGVVCGNSDLEILKTEKPERFLEFGLVTGKPLYLEVHKDVLRDKSGIVIGTVGTGRDITDEYFGYKEIKDKIEDGADMHEIATEIKKLMDKYWFEA